MPLAESGHLKGGVSSGRVTTIAAEEERIGIRLAGELERQLQFARENGLRGVEWMVESPELAAAFERIWAERVRPAVPDVPVRFLVVGG
ncbi:hypothetical protein [Streptomyces rhizosphaericus]|uniref:Uncharacterized protein n=1 Tax=Streptomyces rhizosphaericus TaxID=114699 RepID=A0A6G4A9I0_9ACTN|nr:hypothetical protein [Streptomyces rhizosphaericus]NEW69880.1 hypothetical protein [Streptomyces rhizosphaericus]